MKKFVLVNIPSFENAYHNFKDFVSVTPPIGLLAIAASILENSDYQVQLIDGEAEQLTFEETIEKISNEQPDFVGSTTMTSIMDIVGEFYKRLKLKLPNTSVIVGGPHASALPVKTLEEFQAIDIVVIGEGDHTVVELINAFEKGKGISDIQGIAFRKGQDIVVTPKRSQIKDLNQIPTPAHHLLDFDLYYSYAWNGWPSGHRAPLGVIFMSRGCIGRCNFCAARCVFGKGVRYFPIERIKAEIDYLVKEYSVKILYVQDDTFTTNDKYVNKICDYFIEKGYNKKIEVQVSARADTVSLSTLKKMREAGIRWVCFGVESGNQSILNRMKKNITIEQIQDAFKKANEAGLYVVGNYMIGHIGETYETAMDTIKLACKLKQDYAAFAICIPFPGTELYQHCLDKNIKLPSWNDFGSVNTPPIALNESLNSENLINLRNKAVNSFFIRPSYFFRLLSRLKIYIVIKDFVKTYFALRKERKAKRF